METSLKVVGKTVEPTPQNSVDFYNVFYKVGSNTNAKFIRLIAYKRLFLNVISDIMQTQEDDDQKSYQTKIKNAIEIKGIEDEIQKMDKEFFNNDEINRNVSELGVTKKSFMSESMHEILNG